MKKTLFTTLIDTPNYDDICMEFAADWGKMPDAEEIEEYIYEKTLIAEDFFKTQMQQYINREVGTIIIRGEVEFLSEDGQNIIKEGGKVVDYFEDLNFIWDELEEYSVVEEAGDLYIEGVFILDTGDVLKRKYRLRELTVAGEIFFYENESYMDRKQLHDTLLEPKYSFPLCFSNFYDSTGGLYGM